MTEVEIQNIYDKTYREYLSTEKKYYESISKIDEKCDEILIYIKHADINEFNKQKLYNFKKLSEMMKNKNAKGQYRNYILSYFESLIACRNEMICKNKPIMIYSYLFNLTMFVELILKNLITTNNEYFQEIKEKNYWKSHDIKKIINSIGENLIALGLSKECYDIFVLEVNKLCDFSLITDIAQSFKYPIAKDFSTGIVSEKLFELDIVKIKTIVKDHKKMIFIGLIIMFLTSISNMKWLINNTFLLTFDNLCENFKKIKEELKK